jgi:hypothetical protein
VKSAFSLTLIVCLMTSAVPTAAQNQPEAVTFDLHGPATARPLAEVAMREAARFAAAGEPWSTGIEIDQRGGQSTESAWSRVRRLAPTTEIIVAVKGSPPAIRYFVAADEASLTVMNVTDPTLPPAAMRVLLDMASNRREYFTTRKGAFVYKDVRVGPDDVFVAEQKVANLQHVIETSARTAVAEIKTRQKGRGIWGHLGPLGGYFVGALSGGFVAGLACQAAVGGGRCDTGAFLTGALVGGIVGGGYGFGAANRETEDVIYRAP